MLLLLVSIISFCSSYYIGAIGGIGNRGKMLLNVIDVNHLPGGCKTMKQVRIKWRYDNGIRYVPYDFYAFLTSCSN